MKVVIELYSGPIAGLSMVTSQLES